MMANLLCDGLISDAGHDGTKQYTARIRAELEFSEQSLRLAIDAAEIGTWDLDLVTNVLTWSDRTKAMFGLAPDEPCALTDFYAGLHPEDLDAVTAAFASALNPVERATYSLEYRTLDKASGAVRWIEAKGRGIFTSRGRCVRAIGTAIDITLRKAAEQRLRANEALLAESEQKFRAIADSIDPMVWTALPNGESDFVNQRWYDYTGLPQGSIGLKNRIDLLHPDDRDNAGRWWRDCMATGNPYEIAFRMRHRAGA